jgi:hypothetical protein
MRRIGSRAVSWLVVAAVTAMLSPVSASFAAVNNNEVTSVKIKEADGTSGQDTNSGSGVKTGHIQDGAVTDAKIGGTISVDKLATYAGVKIVHTGPADGVNTFNSIQAAFDSQSASSTSMYIKIMPGTYSESINLVPPYQSNLTIEGSGRENTIIIGGIQSSTGINIYLRNINVVQNSLSSNIAVSTNGHIITENVYLLGDANAANGVTMTDTAVNSGSISSGACGKLLRVLVSGGTISSGGGTVDDCYIIDTVVNAPDTAETAVRAYGERIMNVRASGAHVGLRSVFSKIAYSTFVGSDYGLEASNDVMNLEVANTSLTGGISGSSIGNGQGPTSSVYFVDSTISGASSGIKLSYWGKIDIINSKVSGGLSAIDLGSAQNTTHLVNSQLIGTPVTGVSDTLKILNCYDGSFNLIPNK